MSSATEHGRKRQRLVPYLVIAATAGIVATALLLSLGDRGPWSDPEEVRGIQGDRSARGDEARLRGREPVSPAPDAPTPLPVPPVPPAREPEPAESSLQVVLEVKGESPPPCRVTLRGPGGFVETLVLTPGEDTLVEPIPVGVYEAVVHDVDGWTGAGGVFEAVPRTRYQSRALISWEPAGPLTGRVVDRFSGAAVAGATVRAIVGDDYPFYRGQSAAGWRAVADEAGHFVLPAVPAESSLVLIATAPDYQASDVDVAAGERKGVRVPLSPGGRVTGAVRTSDGHPAAGALVFAVPPRHGEIRAPRENPWLEDRFEPAPGTTAVLFDCDCQQGEVSSVRPPWVIGTKTDESGAYALEGLAVERLLHLHALPARADSRRLPSAEHPLVLAADDPRAHVDFTLNDAARLVLEATAPDGTPAAASLGFLDSPLPECLFRLRGPQTWDVPAGTHRVRVASPAGAPWEGEVTLRPGEEHGLKVRLQPAAALATRVVGPKGGPLDHPGLHAWARQDGGRVMGQSSGEDGRYTFPGLAPGPVEVHASILGVSGSSVQAETVAPCTDLELRIPVIEDEAPNHLLITLRLPDESALPIRVRVGLWPFACGTAYAMRLLRAEEAWGGGMANVGEFELSLRTAEVRYRSRFGGSRPLAVVGAGLALARIDPGDLLEGRAEVVLRPARVVAGTVVDAQGRPVTGARLAADPEQSGMLLHTAADPSGRFRVDGVPPAANRLAVVAPGFADQVVAIPDGPGPHRIVLAKAGVLAVRVRDAAGQPVVRRTVLVFAADDDGGDPHHRLDLYAKSRDVIDVCAGAWRVRDEESGAEARAHVRVGETTEVVLVVP